MRDRSWKLTLLTISVPLVSLLTIGVFLSFNPADVSVRIIHPLLTTQGKITQMSVNVLNQSDRILSPRFAVQRFPYPNPSPWKIDSGPQELFPGESATYRISNTRDELLFHAHEMAQVIVSDSGGDYSLGAVTTVVPDQSFLWPDAIPNPAYEFWDHAENAPVFWSVSASPPESGTVIPVPSDNRLALKLVLQAKKEGLNRIDVQNWINIPTTPFGIWLFWDPRIEDPGSVAYGLEIDDGKHLLWFLFGSSDYSEILVPEQHIVHQTIPPRTWVFSEIDIPAAYDEAGWEFPDLKQAPGYRGLDIDLRMVNLRLFLAANGPRDSSLEAYFGPIEQEGYQIRPQALMAETLDDPAGYYERLAGFYERSRNYGRALEAYRRALQFSADNLEFKNEVERLARLADTKIDR